MLSSRYKLHTPCAFDKNMSDFGQGPNFLRIVQGIPRKTDENKYENRRKT